MQFLTPLKIGRSVIIMNLYVFSIPCIVDLPPPIFSLLLPPSLSRRARLGMDPNMS